MSSPPPSETLGAVPRPDRASLAAAAAARAPSAGPIDDEEARFFKEKADRQAFRRLCFVGIGRANEPNTARSTVKTLLTLADNILNNPGEEKYLHFKTTNGTIKRTLVEVKGGLEYAQAMGFRADVENFQPYYRFRPTEKHVTSLRIGAAILREFAEHEAAREEESKRVKETVQEALARQRQNALLAFEDDRKARLLRDKMEKERQQAILQAAQNPPAAGTSTANESPPNPTNEEFIGSPPSYETIHLRGGGAISPTQSNYGEDSEERFIT